MTTREFMARHCMDCKKPISLCNGFVIASDLTEYLAGRRWKVRELCGLCVFLRGVYSHKLLTLSEERFREWEVYD
jgi:hypothetical protein